MRLISLIVAVFAFLAWPALADVKYGPPSSVGVAAVGQVPGTATNDSASAGNLGEYQSASIAVGSAVTLTSGTAATVVSKSLTAGDWDVACNVVFVGNANAIINFEESAPSPTNNTLPLLPTEGFSFIQYSASAVGPGQNTAQSGGPARMSLSGTTTVYCVAQATYSGTSASVTAYGLLRARRPR